MDKKRNIVYLLFFFFSLILASGCNTVKGATQGACQDLKTIKEADREMQKVLW